MSTQLRDPLEEMEEKYRKAMLSNAQLEKEKTNLMYQVDTLKDSLMELEELLAETHRECVEKSKQLEREKHAHSILQFQFNKLKETLKQSEELLITNKLEPADELPAEVPDMSAPSEISKQTKKAQSTCSLAVCCAGVEEKKCLNELEELLPSVTTTTVAATVEKMLICSEGSSVDVAGDDSDSCSRVTSQCTGRTSVIESGLEVRQSVERCSSELSAVIGHTVIRDLADITTYQSEQDHTSADLHSAAQKVDVGLEKKPSRHWFRLPKFLRLRFKKQTNKACVHMQDQMADKYIPDGFQSLSAVASSSSDRSIPKSRRKSLSTRLAKAFSKICGKSLPGVAEI
ncbi:uncharacterized protein LOC143516279 isoform X1 [Brachyhypopomus gauderio]|uniref:uncharacterized protein LOC143516279 isoform X1 n=2 Tax=Brachyhypopomus gauderio TaxID=698409 RepID=UPI00404227BF